MAARRRHWESRCGRYRVTRSQSLYGLPTVFYAEYREDGNGWQLVQRRPFRTKKAAFRAVDKYAKRQ